MYKISKNALFLDRDGVINIEKKYVYKIEDFQFMDGIFELCRQAIKNHMLIIVVTNQSGIGRGLYTEKDFLNLSQWMKDRFIEENAPITAIYYCPDHPQFGIGDYKKESFDRKPNPGMFLRAKVDYNINLSKSVMIGDTETDIIAAKVAGVGLKVILNSTNLETGSDISINSLIEAKDIIFKNAK